MVSRVEQGTPSTFYQTTHAERPNSNAAHEVPPQHVSTDTQKQVGHGEDGAKDQHSTSTATLSPTEQHAALRYDNLVNDITTRYREPGEVRYRKWITNTFVPLRAGVVAGNPVSAAILSPILVGGAYVIRRGISEIASQTNDRGTHASTARIFVEANIHRGKGFIGKIHDASMWLSRKLINRSVLFHNSLTEVCKHHGQGNTLIDSLSEKKQKKLLAQAMAFTTTEKTIQAITPDGAINWTEAENTQLEKMRAAHDVGKTLYIRLTNKEKGINLSDEELRKMVHDEDLGMYAHAAIRLAIGSSFPAAIAGLTWGTISGKLASEWNGLKNIGLGISPAVNTAFTRAGNWVSATVKTVGEWTGNTLQTIAQWTADRIHDIPPNWHFWETPSQAPKSP